MGTVTKLEAGKKHKDRVNLFIDEEFVCSITALSAANFRIEIGSEISLTKLEEIYNTSELDIAFNKCLDLLSRSVKTVKQMKDYLVSKQFNDKVIENCINKLISYKYICDEKYAEMYVETALLNKGIRRIEYELRLKGIADPVIAKALEQINSDKSDEGIDLLLNKFFKNKQCDYANLIKANRYLLGRGYSYEQVSEALNRYKLNTNAEAETD